MGLEVEDLPAENIIKVMYERRPWKWTMDCWEVTGTKVNTKPKVVTPSKKAKEMVVLEEEEEEEEDNPRPRKKARKEAPKVASEEAREEARGVTREELEIMFKGVADCMKKGFNKCMREFRKLSDRLEAVEKKVGVTNQATPQDKQPTPLAKETGGRNKQATLKINNLPLMPKKPWLVTSLLLIKPNSSLLLLKRNSLLLKRNSLLLKRNSLLLKSKRLVSNPGLTSCRTIVKVVRTTS
ncbi:hypothetical protein Bca101_080041 [Brassica carinata]